MANVNPKNQVTIQGRLGQDVILRSTNGQKSVCNLSVAISNDWFDQEAQEWVSAEPTWITVTLWGALAERYAGELSKGSLVRVMGKLSTRKRNIDKEVIAGKKTITVAVEVTETFVTAASVEVIPSRTEASNSTVSRQSPAMAEPDF
jgi:single stranded DNA-binding protein